MPETTHLRLRYAFVPSPSLIRASAGGANPNSIDLQVIISNPSLATPSIGQVDIAIPVGEEISRDLSSSSSLPAPSYDATDLWEITSAGSTITIKSNGLATRPVPETIEFKLRGIQVNEKNGTVPITITEFPPLHPGKFVDSTTYSLLKLPADFPVTSFYADPARLDDLDLPVKLHWTVSEEGKQHVYGLRFVSFGGAAPQGAASLARAPSAAVPPALEDCVSDGNCYSWEDGRDGVPVSSVNQTTTFGLDVVSAQGGSLSVVGTLETTVQVTMPQISPNSHLKPSASGRFATLHWLAFNAGRCSVMVDGEVIEANAPTDTYRTGYVVTLADTPSPHQIRVIAHAASGSAQASHSFREVVMRPKPKISTGYTPIDVAFTPDGALALVACAEESHVIVVDVATLTAEPKAIAVGEWPASIAVSPDGALAFVANQKGQSITVIDVATREPEPNPIKVGAATLVASSPDGTLLLVSNVFDHVVAVIDVATRAVITSIQTGRDPAGIAFTPDGATAFVACRGDHCVTVIDVASRTVRTTLTALPNGPIDVAVTPDGSLLLVACNGDPHNAVVLVDVASLGIVDTLDPGHGPETIRTTPDGRWALVALTAANRVMLIDIAARTSTTFEVGEWPYAFTLAPDGSVVLAALSGEQSLVVM